MYNPSSVATPNPYQPITLVMKALNQKYFRKQHCMECGQPFSEIVDKVLIAFDGESEIARYETDRVGLIEVQCPRRTCRQHYRMEFAS